MCIRDRYPSYLIRSSQSVCRYCEDPTLVSKQSVYDEDIELQVLIRVLKTLIEIKLEQLKPLSTDDA